MSLSETEAAAVKPAPLIYCGPTLPKGILSHFAVYRGGLPGHLDRHLSDCPAIVRLFVPVDRLNETMKAIEKQGSAENVWFKQVLEYFKGGVKA
jgi:hypothetical protein